MSSSTSNLTQLTNIKWTSTFNNGQIQFQMTSGSYDTNTNPHWNSILDVTSTQSISLQGGYIYRNATNGYVITDAQVTTTGGLDITQTG